MLPLPLTVSLSDKFHPLCYTDPITTKEAV